jgi:hypothetical protein
MSSAANADEPNASETMINAARCTNALRRMEWPLQ